MPPRNVSALGNHVLRIRSARGAGGRRRHADVAEAAQARERFGVGLRRLRRGRRGAEARRRSSSARRSSPRSADRDRSIDVAPLRGIGAQCRRPPASARRCTSTDRRGSTSARSSRSATSDSRFPRTTKADRGAACRRSAPPRSRRRRRRHRRAGDRRQRRQHVDRADLLGDRVPACVVAGSRMIHGIAQHRLRRATRRAPARRARRGFRRDRRRPRRCVRSSRPLRSSAAISVPMQASTYAISPS